MSKYIRKTKDEYQLISNYGYGREIELVEYTYKDIKERLKEYRENCINATFTYKKVRVRL